MKKLFVLSMFLVLAVSCQGYYYSYAVPGSGSYSFDAGHWTENLDASFTPPCIGGWTGSPARLLYGTHVAAISNVAIPDGTSDCEVTLTIDKPGSALDGSYTVYLRASTNTTDSYNTVNPGAGTAYVITIGSSLVLSKRVSGVQNTLASASIPLTSPIVVRAVINGNNIGIWVNGYLYIVYQDSTITSGQPGFGFSNYGIGTGGDSGGNPADGVVEIDLGAINRTGPAPISNLGTSVLPTRVDLQWSGGVDSAGTAYETISRTGLSANLDAAPIGSGLNPPKTVFSDTAVTASTSYTYTITTTDLWFVATTTSFNITTPPTGSVDTRRLGINSVGASWGAYGEQIDLLSGNLNYTLPLLKAQGRGGWGVGFNLTYNSQNWRQDPGGIWQLGQDVGYGFGWKLQAGSLTPFWSNYFTVNHYTFTDATGAQYRLDQRSPLGIWTSKQSIYLSYNPSTQTLYFPDGTFWVFGDTSDVTRVDAGTMYPTQMEDTNGNEILIGYVPASAQISYIQDVRAGSGYTYVFTYDGTGHLSTITNWIGTAEGYTFTYSAPQTLYSPFSSATFGQTEMLQTAAINGLSLSYSFVQDTTGALTKVTLPYGGYLSWAFANYTYSGSRLQPEVQTRYLSKDGSTQTTYPIARDPGDSSRTVHNYANILDPDGVGEKTWYFNTNGTLFSAGLLASRQDQQLPGPTVKANTQYTWTQDSAGNPYVSSALVTLDPGASYQAQKQTNQTLDTNGNLTALSIYDYNNLTTPVRQYAYTYLTGYGYIYNRLATAKVEAGTSGVWQTLVTNYYDGAAVCSGFSGALASVSGQTEHDDTNYGTGYTTRGNVTESVSLTGTSCAQYDMLGNASQAQNPVGQSTSYTYGYNYAVPTGVSMGIYTDAVTWSSFLAQASNTNQNSASTVVLYDSYARPTQTTGANGAVTTYTYTTSPPTVTATINGRWTTTTLDGLGRTLTAASGDGTGTQGTASSVYGSAAVSPAGVALQQSVPYAPGATEYWATTTYDGLGRTLSSQKPDGASTTNYAYQGNTVTVTDPAGNWKQFTMDAMGHLTLVTEPNPAGGANITTTSTYTPLDQVTQVQKTVGSNTQTRTFTYTGAFLIYSTAPETGAMSYSYNANGTLAYKIDAKNQKIAYTYDTLARVTKIDHYSVSSNPSPDTYGSVVISYDSAFGWSGTHLKGQVAEVAYYVGNGARQIKEYFSYTSSGLVLNKQFKVGSIALNAYWTFDNEGRTVTVQYPTTLSGTGSTYTVTYDTMGRANGMTDQSSNVLVSGVTYGPASELLGMTYLGYSQTRQYNTMKQMTRLTTTGSSDQVDFQYSFSATQNNGKITQVQDWISGEQVTYAYDALLRLSSAVTTTNPSVPQWGQSYAYDGFGNLTGQTVTKGTAPYMLVTVDPTTNRVIGGSYDANGNDTSFGSYDVENRMIQATGGALYGYAADNKRVWKAPDGIAAHEEFYFWAGNKRLGTYKSTNPGTTGFTTASTNLYFKGMIQAESTPILKDRLGSNVSSGKRYFPYGQEKPSATSNNTEKFTGYFRDAETGLDYADQRYHNPGTGRFTTPDPAASGTNWYAYASSDPINRTDPSGLVDDTDCTLFCWWYTPASYNFIPPPEVGEGSGGMGWDTGGSNCFTVALYAGSENTVLGGPGCGTTASNSFNLGCGRICAPRHALTPTSTPGPVAGGWKPEGETGYCQVYPDDPHCSFLPDPCLNYFAGICLPDPSPREPIIKPVPPPKPGALTFNPSNPAACREGIAMFATGLGTSVAIAAAFVYAGPSVMEGIAGMAAESAILALMDGGHILSGIGVAAAAPFITLEVGAIQTVQNCFSNNGN